MPTSNRYRAYLPKLQTEDGRIVPLKVQYKIPAGWRRRERLDGTGHLPHMEVALLSRPCGDETLLPPSKRWETAHPASVCEARSWYVPHSHGERYFLLLSGCCVGRSR